MLCTTRFIQGPEKQIGGTADGQEEPCTTKTRKIKRGGRFVPVLWGARWEVWRQARALAEPETEEEEQETAIEFLWWAFPGGTFDHLPCFISAFDHLTLYID